MRLEPEKLELIQPNTAYTQAEEQQYCTGVARWRKAMAAYCRVYDSHHPQADCQELGLAPEPYAR